jgi:hypothetical protein
MPTPRYGNPPALQAKIDRFFQRAQARADEATTEAGAAPPSEQPAVVRYHPNRADRRAAKAQWADFAAQVRASLGAAREETLDIWLPGLQLYSENVALRGDRMPGRHERNKIAVQTAALNEAQLAFMLCESPLWRICRVVSITILQHGRKRDIDPGNLFHKPVVDCLIARGGAGLGIIEDDSARYVSRVTVGYGQRELTGVSVEIRPEETTA